MENTEKQSSSHFSFKWLLRRNRESKSSKTTHPTVVKVHRQKSEVRLSKSCDANLTVCSGKKFSSSYMFGRLWASRSKSPSPCNNKPSEQNPFKTSFSSGDVYGMLNTTWLENSGSVVSKSSQNVSPENAFCIKANTSNGTGHSLKTNYMNNVFDMSTKSTMKHELNQSHHLVLCRLCLVMMPVSEMHQLDNCGCIFCKMCVQQYLILNIKEGNVMLTCPDAECSQDGKIQSSEIERLVNQEVYEMFQRFKLNREVELDPNRTWCPRVNCETVCFVQSSDANQGIPVHCPNCSLTFCSYCKEYWHATKTCEDIKKEKREEEDFMSSDDDESFIKRCPKCHIPIERDEGCAQMMCKHCKHVFCWYCLASLDDDFLLRHYDKGPCKNKLGHSRASVAWHRTQVVGIFAGFGLLMLVAAPFLILAAPCLFCCRCKQCSMYEEEQSAH